MSWETLRICLKIYLEQHRRSSTLSFPTFLCQPKLWLIKLGISSRAVEKQIAKLRSMGILSREGADFGGYWRIILSYHFEGMRRSTLRLYNWRQNWAKKVS